MSPASCQFCGRECDQADLRYAVYDFHGFQFPALWICDDCFSACSGYVRDVDQGFLPFEFF